MRRPVRASDAAPDLATPCGDLDCAHGARLPPTRRAVGLRVGRKPRRSPRRSLAEDERDSGSTEEPGAAQHVDLHRTLERRGRVGFVGHCAGRAAAVHHDNAAAPRGGTRPGPALCASASASLSGPPSTASDAACAGRERTHDAKHRARQLRCLGRLHERREECGGRDERRIKQQYVARARLQRHLEAHQPPPTQPFEPPVP